MKYLDQNNVSCVDANLKLNYGRFPLTLPLRRHYQETVTLMGRLATSQCSYEDDCSINLIFISKSGPDIKLFAVLTFFDVAMQTLITKIQFSIMVTEIPYCFLIGNDQMCCHNRSSATRFPAFRDEGNTSESGGAGFIESTRNLCMIR